MQVNPPDYQRFAIDFIKGHTNAAVFLDMGLGKTVITLFNKADRLCELPVLRDYKADQTLFISAKTGAGLSELSEILTGILRERNLYLERLYPYSEAGKIQLIRKYGQLLTEEYQEEGIAVTAYVPAGLFGKLEGRQK